MAKIKLDEMSANFKDIENEWYEEVKTINTKSKLNNFVSKIMNNYEHDYGTYVHAVAVCTKAFIRLYGGEMSGFQANFLMWQLIRKTFFCDDDIGMQLIKFESVLYPQLLDNFVVEFDADMCAKVIKKAKELIDEDDKAKTKASPNVREHWEKLATGWLPTCIKIKESEVKA